MSTEPALLAKAPMGEIRKTGISTRVYTFFFGWKTRLFLEAIYGKGLSDLATETDNANLIANLLLCGLKSRPANNVPSDFSREQLFELLDDLSEQDVKEVYEVALHALGFTNRILGVNQDQLDELARQALESGSPPPPTGTPS